MSRKEWMPVRITNWVCWAAGTTALWFIQRTPEWDECGHAIKERA